MLDGMLRKGTKLQSINGIAYTVVEMLGSGGQGEVYRVSSPNGDEALKWYYKQTSSEEQKNTIMNLVQEGAPSDNFLWPKDFLVADDGTFGYIMDLRPREYKNIPDLLNRKTEPSFEKLILAVFNMVTEYETLHKRGYSYKDVSDQNVFFNPDTGEVLICDNDNVSGNGVADSGVYGTMRFMAPEIVRGEAMPSRYTDLYSLAVLMFCMLFIGHPLDGMNEARIHALDDKANIALYGTHPVFIYDPSNAENRPVPGIHDNPMIYWESVYPRFLKERFVKAFTDGLAIPQERIVEKQWKDTMVKLLDSIMICPNCGAEVFFDEKREEAGENHICWGCQTVLSAPPQIKIGKHRILLNKNSKIKSHHLNNDYDLSTDVASVSQNPNNPAQWGLRNDSNDTWTYIRPDGTQSMLPPGRTAAFVVGAKINFGSMIGEF